MALGLAALQAALDRLGDGDATPARVRALCVDDRRFLMARLDALLGVGGAWITGACGGCGEPFDVYVDPADVPVKPAGAGYPFVLVPTSRGEREFRVPTGEDQDAAAGTDPAEALSRLAARLSGDESSAWSDEDLAAIDAAVEEVSPRVAACVSTTCPECGARAELPLDHYRVLARDAVAVFEDVHTLASAYGWGEADILALPQARRRVYLDLVEEDAAG